MKLQRSAKTVHRLTETLSNNTVKHCYVCRNLNSIFLREEIQTKKMKQGIKFRKSDACNIIRLLRETNKTESYLRLSVVVAATLDDVVQDSDSLQSSCVRTITSCLVVVRAISHPVTKRQTTTLNVC